MGQSHLYPKCPRWKRTTGIPPRRMRKKYDRAERLFDKLCENEFRVYRLGQRVHLRFLLRFFFNRWITEKECLRAYTTESERMHNQQVAFRIEWERAHGATNPFILTEDVDV